MRGEGVREGGREGRRKKVRGEGGREKEEGKMGGEEEEGERGRGGRKRKRRCV